MTEARPILAVAALVFAGFAEGVPAQLAAAVHVTTHTSQSCSPLGACTYIAGTSWWFNHPESLHLVTSNLNPGGGLAGVYFAASIGSAPHPDFPLERVLMASPHSLVPEGAAFNLLTVREAQTCFYAHTATAGNIVSNVTFLDHPLMNGDPGAFLLVLSDGAEPPTNVGVFYDSGRSQWGIFNEDLSAMAIGRRFSAYVNGCDIGLGLRGPITCTAPVGEICGGTGTLIAPGDPHAKILLTQRWTGVGVYNPHPIGVFYDPFDQAWKVFNEDLADMPLNARFNVAVIDVLLNDDFESGDTAAWSNWSAP